MYESAITFDGLCFSIARSLRNCKEWILRSFRDNLIPIFVLKFCKECFVSRDGITFDDLCISIVSS